MLLRDLQSIGERVCPVRFRHWGFGWIEGIAVPLDNPHVVEGVQGWVEQLQAYPTADDMNVSELEAERQDQQPTLDPIDIPAPSGTPLPSTVNDLRDKATRVQRRLDTMRSTDPPSPGL